MRRYGLEASVRFEAGCPHLQSVAALLRARILLLMEQDSDRGRLLLPGKIFEYMRASRPVLAIVPRGGAAARLVQDLDAGWVADASRPESVAEGISRLLRQTAAGALASLSNAGLETRSSPNPSVARFERRELTRSLASVLDSLR